MTISVGPDGAPEDLDDIIGRLERLAVDLRRIARREAPTSTELGSAPLVDNWVLDPRPHVCLVGDLYGHPILRGPMVRTTEVWAIAPAQGWARTLSRFYRLGRPNGAGEAS